MGDSWRFTEPYPEWVLSQVSWMLLSLARWCQHGYKMSDEDWEKVYEILECEIGRRP